MFGVQDAILSRGPRRLERLAVAFMTAATAWTAPPTEDEDLDAYVRRWRPIARRAWLMAVAACEEGPSDDGGLGRVDDEDLDDPPPPPPANADVPGDPIP